MVDLDVGVVSVGEAALTLESELVEGERGFGGILMGALLNGSG